jgi:sRNA-binding carbon storage regulator CsrA
MVRKQSKSKKKRTKISKPVISKKNQNRLKIAEDVTGTIPDLTSQKVSKALKVTREVGKRIHREEYFTKVKGHYRKRSGKRTYVKPHKRRTKTQYKFKP